MKTATFIEKAKPDQNIAQTVKKEIPWQDSFNGLTKGSIFEAEFGNTGKSVDFKVVGIIEDNDALGFNDTVTFWIEQVKRQ